MSTNDEYEVIEVPVTRKIEVNLSLEDLLNAVTQAATGTQAPPQVLDRLRQLVQQLGDR
jgi:hypothetical protein